MPQLTRSVEAVLPIWRKELHKFPAMTWEEFLSRIRRDINPLATEDRVQIIASALDSIGEV